MALMRAPCQCPRTTIKCFLPSDLYLGGCAMLSPGAKDA
jgi:hypothetical protein